MRRRRGSRVLRARHEGKVSSGGGGGGGGGEARNQNALQLGFSADEPDREPRPLYVMLDSPLALFTICS